MRERGVNFQNHFNFTCTTHRGGKSTKVEMSLVLLMRYFEVFKWIVRLQFNSINNMLTNLFRSEVNIDQGIKEAVNSDQLFKPQRSLIFRGVEEMPADDNL